jgi:uncharacterized protein (TIGR02611 family)
MWVKTVQQAKRLIKMVVGFTLLALGVIMWFTPGPGWAAVIAGLAILAAEFVWARRLLHKIKEKGYALSDAVLPKESWFRRLLHRWKTQPEAPASTPAPAPPATAPPTPARTALRADQAESSE